MELNVVSVKVCFLHLGLHKTASSSFQQTCAANPKLLKANQLHYPIFQCQYSKPKRLKINNHSVPLRCLYDQDPSAYHINKRWKISNLDQAICDYERQLDAALDTDFSLILSGEGLSLLRPVALKKLIDRIESRQFVIQPLALVRSPLDYAHSIAQQLIRGGQHLELIGFGPLASPRPMKKITIPDGLRELTNLLAVFDQQLKLVPFRHACRHQAGPVGFLLDGFCGVKQLADITYQQTQESKSNAWVRLQNQINRRWPAFDRNKTLNPNHFKLKSDFAESGKFRLTKFELSLIENQLRDSNRQLAELLGSGFVDGDVDVSEEINADQALEWITDLCQSTSFKVADS